MSLWRVTKYLRVLEEEVAREEEGCGVAQCDW